MNLARVIRSLISDIKRPVAPAPHHPEPATWSDKDVTVAWLGHATVLINFYGLIILTDPVLFNRVGLRFGPLTIGPKRYIESALNPRELPPIDLILLSHAHMDHLDLRSLSRIKHPSLVVTASHTADIIARLRFRNVEELDWNETRTFTTPRAGGEITITAFKLRHWGARMRNDDHRRYNAYVLERNGRRVCFAGDTAHVDATPLGSRGPIDLFIVPIGAYNPWVNSHCSPEEAVAMANQADAKYLVPIHHQAFKLSAEPMDEPIARFKAALSASPERIALTQVGQTFTLPR
jgi:L-ascorbate metabolism protein UlaG (beta-lactamase superfamily)